MRAKAASERLGFSLEPEGIGWALTTFGVLVQCVKQLDNELWLN